MSRPELTAKARDELNRQGRLLSSSDPAQRADAALALSRGLANFGLNFSALLSNYAPAVAGKSNRGAAAVDRNRGRHPGLPARN